MPVVGWGSSSQLEGVCDGPFGSGGIRLSTPKGSQVRKAMNINTGGPLTARGLPSSKRKVAINARSPSGAHRGGLTALTSPNRRHAAGPSAPSIDRIDEEKSPVEELLSHVEWVDRSEMGQFSSMAAYVQMKLAEAGMEDAPEDRGPSRRPSVNRTATAFHILYELVPGMGAYAESLRILTEELAAAVYQDFHDHEVSSAKGTFFKLQPHFRKAHKMKVAEVDYLSDITDLTSRVKVGKKQITELNAQIQNLRDKEEQATQNVRDMQFEMERAVADIKQLKRSLKASEEEAESAQQRIQYLESQDHMLQIQELHQKLSDAQDKVQTMNTSMERMAVEMSRKDATIANMVTIDAFEKAQEATKAVEVSLKESKEETCMVQKRLAKLMDVPRVHRPDTPRPDWSDVLENILDDVDVTNMSSAHIAKILRVHVDEVTDEALMCRQRMEQASEELSAFRNGDVTIAPGESKGGGAVKMDATWQMVRKNMLTKAQQQSKPKPFVAHGQGPNVPQYLQAQGRVRNRNMGKAETEKLIKEIWKQKEVYDNGRDKVSMERFFYMFLRMRHGVHAVIVEHAYNILDALRRYVDDADCELFLKVLEGNLCEQAFYDQNAMTEAFSAMCHRVNKSEIHAAKAAGGNNVQAKDEVTRAGLLQAMRTFFPHKTEEDFLKLRKALIEQCGDGKYIKYTRLFEDDEDFSQGEFAEMIRDQYLIELETYSYQITDALHAADKMEEGVLSAPEFKAAMKTVDRDRSDEEWDAYLRAGFGITGSTMPPNQTADIQKFMYQLCNSVLVQKQGHWCPDEAEDQSEQQ